jgi:hypothetical protein
MVVDLKFELSYMLSDIIGLQVEVLEYNFDPETGKLCIKAKVGESVKKGCILVKPCKGLRDEARQVRCISKTLTANEKLARELAATLSSS